MIDKSPNCYLKNIRIFAIVTGHSCADVTVYSICNSNNPEIGIYTSIGDDSNGYSKYQSAIYPNYQVYYDIQTMASTKITYLNPNKYFLENLGSYLLQKWLVGEDGETPILNSAESTELCPNNASTWSYVDATQVSFVI